MQDQELDQELVVAEALAVGQRVREELARRRISRQGLADMARISLSTLEKALAGTRPFTLATTLRIEEALGVALRPARSGAPARETAPAQMGAYARAAVAWLEGQYLTLRPSFGAAGGIYAYLTTIRWLEQDGFLGFAESRRLDARFEQSGHVSLPNLSGHIYLVTNEHGQHRLLTFTRPTSDGTLFGMLATLQAGSGAQLVPVAAPIVMWPIAAGQVGDEGFGLIAPGSPCYDTYRARLTTATGEDFVRLYPAP